MVKMERHSGNNYKPPSVQFSQVMQMKYKIKYIKLKRRIKELVYENAALCDEIAETQENIALVKQERKFLLQRFIEYDTDPDVEKLRKHVQLPVVTPKKRGPKKRLNPDGSEIQKASNKVAKKLKVENSPPQKTLAPSQLKFQIPTDSMGKPVFPMNFGSITLHSIGEIVPDNPNFHTEKWIYPVGYMATKIWAHPKEPQKKFAYTCKILNNDGIPQFQIIPDDDFDQVFFGESANICYIGLLDILSRFSDIKNLQIRQQGELFFGLGLPPVQKLLENDPNFTKCPNFKEFSDIDYDNNEDPTLSYPALQKLISPYLLPDVKEELPDELLE